MSHVMGVIYTTPVYIEVTQQLFPGSIADNQSIPYNMHLLHLQITLLLPGGQGHILTNGKLVQTIITGPIYPELQILHTLLEY